jgi:hypothetical protein
MEFGAKKFQNSFLGNEIQGKYVLQRFPKGKEWRAKMFYKRKGGNPFF